MIRTAWRKVIRLLGSAAFATWLLVFVCAWSMIATFVPQLVDAGPEAVADWAAAHPVIEPVAQMLGLHRAFTAPVFLLGVFLLGLSTAICAWERTKVAAAKGRMLVRAASADGQSIQSSHDFEIVCDAGLGDDEVVAVAETKLRDLGIKTTRRGAVVSSVSSRWWVWGSPIFHWALLGIVIAILIGSQQRSEGQMGLAVGQALPDAPESYGRLFTGPLHDWGRVKRAIRVDAFEPDYVFKGINRGPTPTVSVLDANGEVIKTQRVYPNMMLKTGSLTIYPTDHGLSAIIGLRDENGNDMGSGVQLVDFSDEAPEGTVPTRYLVISDPAGEPLMRVFVSVVLDGSPGQFEKKRPENPRVRVVAKSIEGETLLDSVAGLGEELALPLGGGTIYPIDVGYYARLQLVDDWSIPLIYLGLVIATLGLTVSVAGRQQIVLATTVKAAEGTTLAVKLRLWRNPSSSRNEIEKELAAALGGSDEQGSIT